MKKSVEQRFWEKVNKAGPVPTHCPELGSCWEWEAWKDVYGYGSFWNGYRTMRAHRFSYGRYVGDIPSDDLVCHRCDNPRCVRPSHLFIGNAATNAQDAIAKGRYARCFRNLRSGGSAGEANQNAKLTERDVLLIRQLAGSFSQQAIANRFGVSRIAIRHILDRDTWRHI